MNTNDQPPTANDASKYAGFSRFDLELEFVQLLAVPQYLHHLATTPVSFASGGSTKLFEDPAFLAYISYLQYWRQPEYAKFLSYPGPTLKHLELLQQEKFRKDIANIEVMANMIDDGIRAPNGDRLKATGRVGGFGDVDMGQNT